MTGPIPVVRMSRSRETVGSVTRFPAGADPWFGPREQALDVLAVLPQHDQGEREEQQDEVEAAEQCGSERRAERGGHAGDRGDAQAREQPQPDDSVDQPERPVERDDDPHQRGDALAALEPEPDGVAMADERTGGCQQRVAGEQVRDQQHGDRALGHVEQQRRGGEAFPPGAQDVGGADVARADRAQIASTTEPRQDDAERDRAEQVAEHER